MLILGHPKVKAKLENDLRQQFKNFGTGSYVRGLSREIIKMSDIS